MQKQHTPRRSNVDAVGVAPAQQPESHAGLPAASPTSLILQAKLQVGAANDPLEAEADRTAAAFVRSETAGELSEHDDEVFRATDGNVDMMGSFEVDSDVEGRIESARGAGSPLPDRDKYESFFGADLSGVRVHQDAESADLNREIAAKAFTTGTDVFLGRGASTGDKELMAHELTHVVQQGGVARRPDAS